MTIKEWTLDQDFSRNSCPKRGVERARTGFTLVELLVVITIIAILLALAASATLRFIGVQQQTNSEVVVRKVDGVLERQWDIVINKARTEVLPPPPGSPPGSNLEYLLYTSTVLPFARNDAERARVIWIKLRLKQEFPMNFSEILKPTLNLNPSLGLTDLPPLRQYMDAVTAAGFTQANLSNPPSPIEMSSCLLMAISQSRGGVSLNADDLGSDAIASIPNTNLQYIVDGWKLPIVFFRWPTGNLEMDALNPAPAGTTQANFRDPQDPKGILLNPQWWQATHPLPGPPWPFETLVHPLFTISNSPPENPFWPVFPGSPFPPTGGPFPNPNSTNPYYVIGYEAYMRPVVASAGKNKSFGLLGLNGVPIAATGNFPNPMAADGTGDDNDNIYSYRLR